MRCWVAPSDLHEANEIAHAGPEAEAEQELPVHVWALQKR